MRTNMEERYHLALERIRQILTEDNGDGIYRAYCQKAAGLFQSLDQVFCAVQAGIKEVPVESLKDWNRILYEDIWDHNYEHSYANPRVCCTQFGKEEGGVLCSLYSRFREGIEDAYDGDRESLVLLMELFLQVYTVLTTEQDVARWLKETLYFYVHDYDEYYTEKNISKLLDPSRDRLVNIVMESDLQDDRYLYYYGEHITDNEIRTAHYMRSLPQETVARMAQTFTEGYRQGFIAAGIDLSKKETVGIRYNIGFERVIRESVRLFEKMGLVPVIFKQSNTRAVGVCTTPANKQYMYDHRFDDALYLNKALIKEKLAHVEKAFEAHRELAGKFAGPALMEVFGEKLFVPQKKPESLSYTPEQQKLSVGYRRDYALIQSRYIKEEERSFTIIAFPIPEIGDDFEHIFKETIKLNTLDMELYRKIHQALIDALDQGDRVRITGRGANQTDLTVKLHELRDPQTETNFENCLADVNIPVGEVFTQRYERRSPCDKGIFKRTSV